MAVPVALAEDSGKVSNTTPAVNSTVTPTVAPTIEITPTPAANVTATPTAAVSPTPVPTPAPRKVFSSAKWENDHVSVLVTNTGGPITVEAYIDNPSDKNIVPVNGGANVRVNTNSITAEAGQIIVFGFKAYDNGTQIDTFESSVVAGQTQASPTPPAETAILKGTVVDSATSAPVSGARVTFQSTTWGEKKYTATTDEAGGFTSSSMYTDSFVITVSASGYSDYGSETSRLKAGIQTLDNPIAIKKVSSGATPTAAPTPTPTPTPASPLDAWIALLSSPAACIATAGGAVGLIVSLTALYEWFMRQKERRGGAKPPELPKK